MERTNSATSHRPNATDQGYSIDPASDYFTTDRATNHSKRAAAIMLLVGAITFGSFLWLRMRLVTDMPRQAYADPDSAQQQGPRQDAPQQDAPQQPQQDNSRKVMDLEDHDTPRDTSTPYSVNDASGGSD